MVVLVVVVAVVVDKWNIYVVMVKCGDGEEWCWSCVVSMYSAALLIL